MILEARGTNKQACSAPDELPVLSQHAVVLAGAVEDAVVDPLWIDRLPRFR